MFIGPCFVLTMFINHCVTMFINHWAWASWKRV